MAASAEGLVPITRSFLARYYDRYPLSPLPDGVSALTHQLRGIADELLKESPLGSGEEPLAREADLQPPHKIDENLWRNREHIEEILFLLDKSHWPISLQQKATPEDANIAAVVGDFEARFQRTLKALEIFQIKNADNVFNTVMTYMPQDFRGSLIRQQKERSERNRQAEVDALVKSGGSIHDRYALLWKQQMERRKQLAQLGSAAGVYKTLVKYLVGVPQVLLDFIKQINDDQGPMEEQRQRYGPSLYSLTKLVLSIRLVLLLSWGRFEAQKLEKDQLSVIEQAVQVYTYEFEKFIKFIGEVFANSPFLIYAEDAGAAESRKSDEYKETTIQPGKSYEVNLFVDSVNSYIAWDFSVIQGTLSQDIGFRVEYVSPSGETTLILPYRRYESDQVSCFYFIIQWKYRILFTGVISALSSLDLINLYGTILILHFSRRVCGIRWMLFLLWSKQFNHQLLNHPEYHH